MSPTMASPRKRAARNQDHHRQRSLPSTSLTGLRRARSAPADHRPIAVLRSAPPPLPGRGAGSTRADRVAERSPCRGLRSPSSLAVRRGVPPARGVRGAAQKPIRDVHREHSFARRPIGGTLRSMERSPQQRVGESKLTRVGPRTSSAAAMGLRAGSSKGVWDLTCGGMIARPAASPPGVRRSRQRSGGGRGRRQHAESSGGCPTRRGCHRHHIPRADRPRRSDRSRARAPRSRSARGP